MARARKAPTKQAAPQRDGQLTCPECGKTFDRPASLGAHRKRAHGVAGTSARARSNAARSRAGAPAASARSRRARAGQRRSNARANGTSGAAARVDRDALLQTLFPQGVPAREAVIRRVNAWLDEAEQLAAAG